VSHLKVAVGASALGMYDALGYPLAVEMRQLIYELVVLKKEWAIRSRTQTVVVIMDGCAVSSGEERSLSHLL